MNEAGHAGGRNCARLHNASCFRVEALAFLTLRVHGAGFGCLGVVVWGLWFGVWGLGFGVLGLGFGVLGFGCGVLGFGVWGFGFGVLGLSFWVWGLGCGV